MAETESKNADQVFDIPKECKAGVVVNEGPDFRVEVQMVPVPEIRMFLLPSLLLPYFISLFFYLSTSLSLCPSTSLHSPSHP